MIMPPQSYAQACSFVGGAIAVCDSKVAYPKRSDALKAANFILRVKQAQQAPYRCAVCNEWHLTSRGAPQINS
jgi:hypothetical protein